MLMLEPNSEVEKLKAEKGRLRELNTTLIKYLLGNLYISQQNTLFTREVLQRDSMELLELVRRLLSSPFHARWDYSFRLDFFVWV